jgi:DNA invertase Pin-like site-specific DNA recombinase
MGGRMFRNTQSTIAPPLSSATSTGKLLLHHVIRRKSKKFATEPERDLIRERTRAGLSAAAARGRKGGRKAVVTAEKLKRAKLLIESGLTVREAAARIKVGKTALYDAINADTSRNAPN